MLGICIANLYHSEFLLKLARVHILTPPTINIHIY